MNRFLLIAVIFLAIAVVSHAQPTPMANPSDLGLRLPAGKTAFEVVDRQVLFMDGDDEAAEPIVAKVYLEVGSHYVLVLPDGSLRSVEKRLVTETDRPFEPISKDELAEQLKQQFRGFKTRATRHYLCVYNTSDAFCERKSKILETMYPNLLAYFRRQKLDPVEPDLPLVVVMFRTKREFQEYRKTPDQMLAYYNTVNNRVFMYQYSEMSKDAPWLAIKQSTSTVAHEGVHQILHNIGVQKRLSAWPLWISEGIAEYFAPTSSGIRSKWKGVGRPNEFRMRELFLHLRERENIGDGSLVEATVTAKQFDSTDYAVAWSLVHYMLTKRRDDFFEYMRDVSEGLPLEASAGEKQRFEKYFGRDHAKLEREMLRHIKGLPYVDPIANQPYFLVTAVTGKKRHATVTSSPDVKRIEKEMLIKMSVADRARAVFRVRRFPNQRTAAIAMQVFMKSK